MVDRVKRCRLSNSAKIRLNNFMYIFNLRQGTILIAVHQIALSSFILILLLVALSHVGEMLSMLHSDMEDDAERHGFYEISYGDRPLFHEGDGVSTNNQRRFAKAQHLASVTVILLYTSTVLTSIYLICCISLLYGAIKYKHEYMMAWVFAAAVGLLLMMLVAFRIGDGYPCLVKMFGGHDTYYISCLVFIATFLYAMSAVASFALDTARARGSRGRAPIRASSDERGERLVLLDHAAHTSLLSAAQLNKLNHGTRTQFV